jgi:hypothetical protein
MGFSNYWDLRKIAQHFEAETIREALIRMVDAQVIINLDESDANELPGMGDLAPNGKPLAYGKRTKRKKHFTPDTMPTQASLFGDIDHNAPAPELEDWEGERVNRNLNRELSRGHVDDD